MKIVYRICLVALAAEVLFGQQPSVDELLAQFLRAEKVARSGGLNKLNVDPVVLTTAAALMYDDPKPAIVQISTLLDRFQFLGGPDPDRAMANLGNYSTALASMLQSICKSDSGCLRVAYGALLTNKGSLPEVISKRPRSFLDGTDKATNAAQDALRRGANLTFAQKQLVAMYGEDILQVPPEKLTEEIKLRDSKLTDEQKLERTVRVFQEMNASPQGQQFNQALGMDAMINATMQAAQGKSPRLEFLNQLKDGEVWVDFFRFKPRSGNTFGEYQYVAVMATSATDAAWQTIFAAKPVEAAIEALFTAVNGGRPAEAAWTQLLQIVWRPLRAALPEGTKRVYLSPDSALGLVPWAGLSGFDPGSPLVTVMQSAYQLTRANVSPAKSAGKALIAGDLDFGAGDTFDRLPGTANEIGFIERLAKENKWSTTVLRGKASKRADLLAGLNDATLVHLATHGFMSESTKPVAGSAAGAQPFQFDKAGIALSGANEDRTEGILTAKDVARLDLRSCSLMVVSACTSGYGRASDGQGVLGFQTAFSAAGVRSMLVSLWSVPDDPTVLLMQEFYKAWWTGGRSKAEALRIAQEKVRRDFPKVENWGAWQLVGEAF